MLVKNKIIPEKPILYTLSEKEHQLNYEAIATFMALGFFLDKDTYWKDEGIVGSGTNYALNERNELTYEKHYFDWHYTPRDITLNAAVEEFTHLFDSSFLNFKEKKIILPLSGGIDSRCIAASISDFKNANAYSYHFSNGINESLYGKRISNSLGFQFNEFIIPEGYLWSEIDRLAKINHCYAEFTHPRQMYIFDKLPQMGDLIIGGHGGDLFFDGMGVDDNLSFDQQVNYLFKKLLKKGGLELANSLWKYWGLTGNFKEYLMSRIATLLLTINIENANSRLRAFKSKYYVTRWTMVNMQIFQLQRPVFLPFFTDEMCQFICTIPEELLKNRQIQIQFIKNKSKNLAKIEWQANRPFNLNNYNWNKNPYNLPYRFINKVKRMISNKTFIQRNWELQFLGKENDEHLKEQLFNEPKFSEWIPKELVEIFYQKFKKEDTVKYSHAVSMLLTLSIFSKHLKH